MVLLGLGAASCGDDGGVGTATAATSGGSTGTTTDGPTGGASDPSTGPTPTTGLDTGGSNSMSDGMTTSGTTAGTTAGPDTTDTTGTTGTTGADLCGNAAVDPGEACDDGVNDGAYDGCAPDCSALGPSCGDSAVDGPEECDDGNQTDDDACSNACVAAVCGDGVVQAGAGEACDDANLDDTDACVGACALASCGDGFIQAGVEACDDAVNDGAYDGCAQGCAALGPSCGDAVKNGPEGCDDGNPSQQDGCLTTCVVPKSCLEVKMADAAAPDGVYKLAVGDVAWQAYCDMTFDGGGWTLAAKTIPTDGWAYGSARWTDNMLVNVNMPDFDHSTAKLATWNLVPFTEILLGIEAPAAMMNPPKPNYLKLATPANSLFALFSPDKYVATSGTKAGWSALIPMPALQANCNKEGVNNAPNGMAGARVRLGLLGNTQNDCNTPESAIGVGLGNFACQPNPFMSVGNIDCEPNPVVKKPGMGWIFVR